MHTIYHTEAIIVRSEPAGEANKRVWLFTKELGLVIAMVQGVRKPAAKLQNHISEYSVILADLVKGKSTWRLVSAKVIDNPLQGTGRAPSARAYVRTIAFLERFLVGEGIHEELFNHILAMGDLVKENTAEARLNDAVGQARILDALSLWKMLALLGYMNVSQSDQTLLSLPFAEAVPQVTDMKVKELIKSATDAIAYSHL